MEKNVIKLRSWTIKDNKVWQKINHKTVRLDDHHILVSMSIIVDCSRIVIRDCNKRTIMKLLHSGDQSSVMTIWPIRGQYSGLWPIRGQADILGEWWRVMKWIMTRGAEITAKTILIIRSRCSQSEGCLANQRPGLHKSDTLMSDCKLLAITRSDYQICIYLDKFPCQVYVYWETVVSNNKT